MRLENLKGLLKNIFSCGLILYSASAFSEENTFYDDPAIPLRTQLDVSNLVDYWSAERMANAKPKEPRENPAFIETESLNIDFESPQEVPGIALTKENPTDANLSLEPHRYGGKLFFTMGGADYMCSAQLVGSANILLTAAHCLKDENTGEWAANSLFVQQYEKGKGKKRKVICLTAKNGWRQSVDKFRWDYGFMKIEGGATGGYMGLRTSLETGKWSAMGYPSAFRNGQVMQKASGMLGKAQYNLVEMLNNRMGKGSSGGAWFVGNTVIGLNSFIYLNNPNIMWGPDFNKETLALYEYAKKECK